MSFTLPDLVIEGAIRKGFDLMSDQVTRDAVIDVVFNFTLADNNIDGGLPGSIVNKYTFEKTRLQEFFASNEVAIVHSFSDVQTQLPCVSIQLQADGEDQGLALADDFGGTGAGVLDSGELAGYSNRPDLNIIHANTVINVGIHTKEQLLTKYLYHLTKYFILSAKLDLIRQNFIVATFRGSDFSRDAAWQGDHVYTRFLNISGKTEDSWTNLDEIVAQIEQINVNTIVPTDVVQFNNPASEVSDTIIPDSDPPMLRGGLLVGDTEIYAANSFYLPDSGPITLVTRGPIVSTTVVNDDGKFIIVNPVAEITIETVNIINNDRTTNILTVDPITMDHRIEPAMPENSVRVALPPFTTFVVSTVNANASATVQSRPDALLTSSRVETNNDVNGEIHRTN